MKILELEMIHFGKFEHQKVLFHEGVNIICGNNESGKSTIHAFIRAMLYGLEKTRGRSRIGEYELRQPWENPSWFAGTMNIEHAGKVYRIERNFTQGAKGLHLINETDGVEIENAQDGIDRILYHVSEAAFCNTVYITQAGAAVDASLSDQLKGYLLNMQETGDAGLDVASALEQLRKQKKELETKRKQKQAQLGEKIEQKRLEYEAARSEIDRLEMLPEGENEVNCVENADGSTEENSGKKREEKIRRDIDEDTGMRRQKKNNNIHRTWFLILAVFSSILMSLTGMCIFLSSGGIFRILMCVMTAGFLFAAGASFYGFFMTSRNNDPDDLLLQDADPMQETMQARKLIRSQILREEKNRKVQIMQEKKEELEKLYEAYDQTGGLEQEIAAVDLAMSRIREVSQQICGEIGDDFEQNIARILTGITGGRYTDISLDERMNVMINTPEKLLHAEQLSYAAMHQVYFALRMAAAALMDGENLPLFLDETFAMYDENRLQAVMEWLAGSVRQVILFTSSRREQKALEIIQNT